MDLSSLLDGSGPRDPRPEHFAIVDALNAIGTPEAIEASRHVEKFANALVAGSAAIEKIAIAQAASSVPNVAFRWALDYVQSFGARPPAVTAGQSVPLLFKGRRRTLRRN